MVTGDDHVAADALEIFRPFNLQTGKQPQRKPDGSPGKTLEYGRHDLVSVHRGVHKYMACQGGGCMIFSYQRVSALSTYLL